MNKTVTLLEFLEASGAKVRIHDIGRRIIKIPREEFLKFERQQATYPYPLQQQAWFAVSLHSNKLSEEPVIWFIRFPLDETGKLLQASRDYFIHRLLEAAAASQQTEPYLSADALKDNPHVFKPREDTMAMYHARLSSQLKKPPSRYYQHAREYFSGDQGWEQWNFVGYQGIADIVERLDIDNNSALLAKAIIHLPPQPLEALCQCLENTPVAVNMAQALLQRCEMELDKQAVEPALLANLCRGISMTKSSSTRDRLLNSILQSPHANQPEVVGAIAARCWEWLHNPQHASLYLEQLSLSGQETFNLCLTDLLFIPGLRDTLLSVIRNPSRSDKLAQTFSNMMRNYS